MAAYGNPKGRGNPKRGSRGGGGGSVDVGWAGSAKASDTTLKADHTYGWDYPDKSTQCKGGSVNASSSHSTSSGKSGLGPRTA